MPIELAKLLLWGIDGTTRVTILTLSPPCSAPPSPAIHILGHLSPHNTLGGEGKDAKASEETVFLAGVNFPAPAALSLSWAGTQTSGPQGPSLGNKHQMSAMSISQYPWMKLRFHTHRLEARRHPRTCQVTEWGHPELGCAQVLFLLLLSPGQVVRKDVQAVSILCIKRGLF